MVQENYVTKVPVAKVTLASIFFPLRHPVAFAVSIMFALLCAGLVFGLAWYENSLSLEQASAMDYAEAKPNFIFKYLIFVLPVCLITFVGLFNYWIRLGALQDRRAWRQSPLAWIGQILRAMLHLFWIGVVVGFAVNIAVLLGAAVFLDTLLPSLTGFLQGLENGAMSDPKAILIASAISLPLVWIASYVYARFSHFIVHAAMGHQVYDFQYPDEPGYIGAFSFSIVLTVVYFVGTLAQMVSDTLSEGKPLSVLNLTLWAALYLYSFFIIAAAHGIVFRLKSGGLRPEDVEKRDDTGH